MVARLVPQQQQLPEEGRVGGERGRKSSRSSSSSSSSSSSRERSLSRRDCSSALLDANGCCLQLDVTHGRAVMLTTAPAAAADAVCVTTMASGEIKPDSDRSLLSSTSFSSLSSSNHRLLYDSDDSSILAVSSTASLTSRAPTPSRRQRPTSSNDGPDEECKNGGAVATSRSSSLATNTPNGPDLPPSSSCLSQPAAATKQPSESRRSLVRRRDQRRASLAALQGGDSSQEKAASLDNDEDATSIMAIAGPPTEATKSLPRRQRRPSNMDIVAAATATPATTLSTDSVETLPARSRPRSCLRTTSSTESKNRRSRSQSKRQLCRSVSFIPDAEAKHGVLETILGGLDDASPAQQQQLPLTEEERIAAWYNGRNYKLFRSTQHNETMGARNDAPENVAYRHDFALVWNTCTGRVDRRVVDKSGDGDRAFADSRAALSTAVRHLSQSRLRGLERAIFAATLSKHRTATVRAIVAAHCTETAQLLPQTTDSKPHSSKFSVAHRVRMTSLQHTQPFRRLARLMAQGDAKVVSTWHQRDKHKGLQLQCSLPEQPHQQPVPAELPQGSSLNVTAHSPVEATETRTRAASTKSVKSGKRRNLLLNYSDHSSSSRRRTKTSSTRRLSVSAADNGSSSAKSIDLGASVSTTSTSSSSTATWHSYYGSSNNSCLSGNLLDQGEHASCRHLLLQRQQQQQQQQQQQHATAVTPNMDRATVPTAPAAA